MKFNFEMFPKVQFCVLATKFTDVPLSVTKEVIRFVYI